MKIEKTAVIPVTLTSGNQDLRRPTDVYYENKLFYSVIYIIIVIIIRCEDQVKMEAKWKKETSSEAHKK